MFIYLNSWEYTLSSVFWTERVNLFSLSLKLALKRSSHTIFQHRPLTWLIRKFPVEIGQLYFMCLRKPSLLSLMPCTGFPCKAKHFFSVKALVETRWCFVHHCVWILWFPLRGLTGFSFANILVFKPLLNYCMALFDSPFFLVIPLRRKKRRKGILYWNASFHLLGISLSVLHVSVNISDSWLKLLMVLCFFVVAV